MESRSHQLFKPLAEEKYNLKNSEQTLELNHKILQLLAKLYTKKDNLGLPAIDLQVAGLIDSVGNMHVILKELAKPEAEQEINEEYYSNLKTLNSELQTANIQDYRANILKAFEGNKESVLKNVTDSLNSIETLYQETKNHLSQQIDLALKNENHAKSPSVK